LSDLAEQQPASLTSPIRLQQTAPTDNPPHALFADTEDDMQAVSVWLAARAERSPHTFDAYRRESQRLLVWLNEQKISLKNMHLSDLHRYYQHLQHPPEHWLRPRKPRQDQILLDTQLLISGLSPSSLDYARRVLGLLFDYLQQAGYLSRNLIRLSQRPATIQQQSPTVQRFMTVEQWQWLWHWLSHRPRHTATADAHFMRDRWLMLLLYHTGLRRDEVAQVTMADFKLSAHGWSLQVLGKGRKLRSVSIHPTLMHALAEYRLWLGLLHAEPQPSEQQIPLVAALNQSKGLQPLTARAIGLAVQQIGQSAAAACPDPQIAATLQQLSTHWLRHTNATHRLLAGASLETTQDELGHSDPKTTRRYVHSVDEQRRADLQRLMQFSADALALHSE